MGGERNFRFDRIRLGDRLEIRGVFDAQGNIVATRLRRRPPKTEVVLQGPVDSIALPIWSYVELRYGQMRPQSSKTSLRIVLLRHSFSLYSGQGRWSKSKVSYCAGRLWPSRRLKLNWQTQTGTTICNRGATPTSQGVTGIGQDDHCGIYAMALVLLWLDRFDVGVASTYPVTHILPALPLFRTARVDKHPTSMPSC